MAHLVGNDSAVMKIPNDYEKILLASLMQVPVVCVHAEVGSLSVEVVLHNNEHIGYCRVRTLVSFLI